MAEDAPDLRHGCASLVHAGFGGVGEAVHRPIVRQAVDALNDPAHGTGQLGRRRMRDWVLMNRPGLGRALAALSRGHRWRRARIYANGLVP